MAKKKTTKKKVTKKDSHRQVRKEKYKEPTNTEDVYVFGRPTKYKKEFAQQVYESCKAGDTLTIASICVTLDICRDTYHKWRKDYPEFSAAIKKGVEWRKHHMEKKGLSGMHQGKNFNAVPWLFLMKNLFPDEYKDKQEVVTEDKSSNKRSFTFTLEKKPDYGDKNDSKD